MVGERTFDKLIEEVMRKIPKGMTILVRKKNGYILTIEKEVR